MCLNQGWALQNIKVFCHGGISTPNGQITVLKIHIEIKRGKYRMHLDSIAIVFTVLTICLFCLVFHL